MTSSHKAIGLASVRRGPTSGDIRPVSAWTLDELYSPVEPEIVDPAVEAEAAERAAEDLARRLHEEYLRGVADGEARAADLVSARVAELVAITESAAEQFDALTSSTVGVIEENVAALAVIVARHIVGREVATDPELIADLVRRALAEFPVDQPVHIRVNPTDLALLAINDGGGAQASANAPITGARKVSWLADPQVTRGGCLIEGRDRVVDGRVDTALERAYRRLVRLDA